MFGGKELKSMGSRTFSMASPPSLMSLNEPFGSKLVAGGWGVTNVMDKPHFVFNVNRLKNRSYTFIEFDRGRELPGVTTNVLIDGILHSDFLLKNALLPSQESP
jgi:hypothetical protein